MADFVEGIAKLNKKLAKMDFHSSRQTNIIRRVARKGGNVLKDEVKRLIPSSGAYPEIPHIKKSVKVVTSKARRNPGVNVFAKGAAALVSPGAGRDSWTLGAYQYLVYFGNYKNYNRTGRLGKVSGKRRGSGQSRGNVRGATNYNPYERAKRSVGKRALIVMAKNLRPEVIKEFKKLR